MKISLITINRNNAKGLARTLDSIAAQLSYLPQDVRIEHILVDGNSTDNSLSKLNPDLDSLVIQAEPKGVYHAVNTGLKHVSGDIIGLLHSGDVFAKPDIFGSVAQIFLDDESVDFTWGDITIGRRLYSSKNFVPSDLLTGFAPPHPSLYIRRSASERIGFYDESYRTAADFEYFVRLFNDKTLTGKYNPAVMVHMQPGGASHSLINRLTTNNTERLRALASNGLPASRLRLLAHYKHIIKGYLCSYKKK